MSDDLGFPHDNGEIAWGHFLAQHVDKKNTADFVYAFYKPLDILDRALSDLYTMRWLETATGDQLDGIGSIVGIGREVEDALYIPFFGFISQPSGRAFGEAKMRKDREPYATTNTLGDDEYRIMVILKIAFNNGHGTAEEIIYALNTAFGLEGCWIDDAGNANANVYITDINITPADPRFYMVDRYIPRAAGVLIFPHFVHPIYTFGFLNQKIYFGFGLGVIARTPHSNRPPISFGWPGETAATLRQDEVNGRI